MALRITILVNDSRHGRRPILADLMKSNQKTIWVRLPDGNVIKRKRSKDIAN